MTKTSLISIGSQRVDHALQELIGVFETTFPGRVRAYYVEGSYADGSAVVSSDVDLVIVFKDRFADERESQAARQLGAQYASLSRLEFDLDIIDEDHASRGAFPTLKLASALVYGEDMRDRAALPPIEDWTRDRMHAAYWLSVKAFNRPPAVRYPLGYPRPHEEFLGYDQRIMRLPSGEEVRCTRDLIRVTGWAATALIALKAGAFVARKRECHQVYQRLIGDQWSELLRAIYERCKTSWSYQLPTAPADRRELRAICERTLEFENHFLRVFRDFVLGELRGADHQARRDALWLLRQLPYQDETIGQALRGLAATDDPETGQLAAAALAAFEVQTNR